jgi:hypothetical protein
MSGPIRLTHADVARAFADRYRSNFNVFRPYSNSIEVWVKGDDRTDFEHDVKRYHLRRSIRAYLDWLFTTTPEPKPLKLKGTNFLTCVMREAIVYLYDPEGR